MPKSILIAISVVFGLVGIVSFASNFQQSSLQEKNDKANDIAFLENQQREWKNVLLEVPQYKPSSYKEAAQNSDKAALQKSISDSTIVGIVLDEPSSILLVLKDSSDIQTFGIGEGWLENWVIDSIQADSVNWLNLENKTQYVQPLFDLTKPIVTPEKKRSKRNKRKK